MSGPRAWLALSTLLLASMSVLGHWDIRHDVVHTYDDAFITFRYARNLASGEGLVYNPGERVLGTTAPGFAVLLGLLEMGGHALGLTADRWAILLSGLSLWSIVLLLLLGLPPRWGSWAAGAYAILAFGCSWNDQVLGGEAPLVVALCAWGIWLTLAASRKRLGIASLTLAALIRPDAVLAVGVVALLEWRRQKRFPLEMTMGVAIPITIAAAGAALYYGSPVPLTLEAKRLEASLRAAPPPALAAVKWWFGSWGYLPGAAVVALASGALLWSVARGFLRRPEVRAVGSWIIATELFYVLVGVPFAPWYHLATVQGILVLSAAALARAVTALRPKWLWSTFAFFCLAAIVAPSFSWIVRGWSVPTDGRLLIYGQVGEVLRECERGTVAVVEIGVVGWTSGQPILDLVGLVSPVVVEARKEGNLRELVSRARPRYIVDVPMFRGDFPFLTDELAARYRRVGVFLDQWSGRGHVRLLELREQRGCPG